MEINIPKIYKIEFKDVVDHIEEMIFEKIKFGIYNGEFNIKQFRIDKINCKILGIENDDKYNYFSPKYEKTIINTCEDYFNLYYKGKQLSKNPELKNIKYIFISDVIFKIYDVIDNIFYRCKPPQVNFSKYEAYKCIKNKDFQNVTLDKFDLIFYLNEIYDEISRRFSLCSYDAKKLCTMFENNLEEINITYKNFYDFAENDDNLIRFQQILSKNINYKSFIDQLTN